MEEGGLSRAVEVARARNCPGARPRAALAGAHPKPPPPETGSLERGRRTRLSALSGAQGVFEASSNGGGFPSPPPRPGDHPETQRQRDKERRGPRGRRASAEEGVGESRDPGRAAKARRRQGVRAWKSERPAEGGRTRGPGAEPGAQRGRGEERRRRTRGPTAPRAGRPGKKAASSLQPQSPARPAPKRAR